MNGAEPADHRHDPEVPGKGEYSESARLERLRWAEAMSGRPLTSIGNTTIDPRDLRGNVENYVGSIEIPVGLAGPLRFDGSQVQGWRVAPMATTEGALVASTSRGARALSRAGGVRTTVLGQRLARAPMFEFDDSLVAQRFVGWLAQHRAALEVVVSEVSAHARLVDLQPHQLGRTVHVSFVYETADAAGQNMTTATTWHALQWMQEPLAAAGLTPRHWQIEAGFSGDKRQGGASLTTGRGIRAVAECVIPGAIVRHVLKIDPVDLVTASRHLSTGGLLAGQVGYTANAANMVAAIFAATGQDLACVYESSVGMLQVEADGDGVYASLTLPSLAIGTVGGGTKLAHFRESLDLLGCAGAKGSHALAEIIVGFGLGLDLSLTAALFTNQFATAHERLGRNRPVEFLSRDELDSDRLAAIANEHTHTDRPGTADHPNPVVEVRRTGTPLSAGIITDLGSRVVGRKYVGMETVELRLADGSTRGAVLKVKATDREVLTATGAMAALLGPDLAVSWRLNEAHLGFAGLHTRELGLARRVEECLERVRPEVLGIWEVPEREIAVLMMEHLADGVTHLDCADEPGSWDRAAIEVALRDIAPVHAEFWERGAELSAQPWFGPIPTPEDHADAAVLYRRVLDHASLEYPDWFPPERTVLWARLVDGLAASRRRAAQRPQTLVHHDFNPRNAALRRPGMFDDRSGPTLVLWDWELATVDLCQRDVAEFLAFALVPETTAAEFDSFVEVHRRALSTALGVDLDPQDYRRDLADGLHAFAATRLLQYVMVNEARDFRFLGRLIDTTARLVDLVGIEAADAPIDLSALQSPQ